MARFETFAIVMFVILVLMATCGIVALVQVYTGNFCCEDLTSGTADSVSVKSVPVTIAAFGGMSTPPTQTPSVYQHSLESFRDVSTQHVLRGGMIFVLTAAEAVLFDGKITLDVKDAMIEVTDSTHLWTTGVFVRTDAAEPTPAKFPRALESDGVTEDNTIEIGCISYSVPVGQVAPFTFNVSYEIHLSHYAAS